MAVQSEKIQLTIVASGSAAKKELADLTQQKVDLERKIQNVNKSSKNWRNEQAKLRTELKGVNERMRKVRGEMDLNGMSMRDLRNRARDLKRVMDNMNPDSPEWRKLDGDLQRVNGRMKQLRGSAQQMKGTWSTMMNAVKGGLVAYAGIEGVRALWRGATSAVKAYTEQAKAVAKVDQAIRSTAGAAQLSLTQLQKAASNLQKKTLFGDEDILNNATAQLLTFTNIAGNNFLRTQQVALDLSTVLDGDLKSASIQLGKALNDPVANLSALSRSGIQFSKAQKEVIKGLAESGRLAEAQVVILDELEKQYGGQAEAAAKVSGGWEQLGNVLGDTMEEIGGLISAIFNTDDATTGLINGISTLNERITEWTQNVINARNWLREWYKESEAFRGIVQLLVADVKIAVTFVVQLLDQAVVKPIQGVIAGVKAARHALNGEFEKAGAVLKAHVKMVADDWKEFGSDIKETVTDAYHEVRNPEPWEAMSVNATNAAVKVVAAVETIKQAQQDLSGLSDIVGSGGEAGTDSERGGETTDSSMDQEFFQQKMEFYARLQEMRMTARELELLEEEMYWDEMIQLNKDYATGATDLEERKRAALGAINAKWDKTDIENTKNTEATKQQLKRETLQNVANMSSQFLGFIGDYMEKGSAAQIATASTQVAIDSATSISSAIKGATEAASAGGPTAPFLIMGYITSMIGTVMSAFTQVSSIMDSAKQAKVDTDVSVPAFAKGTKGGAVTPPGWKLVGEEGPELINTPGGEKVITAPDTASILSKYNASSMMPVPRFRVDASALNSSVKRAIPGFANGTMGAVNSFMEQTSSNNGGMSVIEAQMERLIAAVMDEKARPAIVSQRQLKDKETDLSYIRDFSDIKN